MDDHFESYPSGSTAKMDARGYRARQAKQSPAKQIHKQAFKKTYATRYNDARLDSQNDLDMVDKHREKIPTAALFGYPKNPPRQNWHSYGICFISRQLNERGFPSVLAVCRRESHRSAWTHFGFPKGVMEPVDRRNAWACAVREVFREELNVPFEPPNERPREYKRLKISDKYNGRGFIHIFVINGIDKRQNFSVRDDKELYREIHWLDIDSNDVLNNVGERYFTMYRFVRWLYGNWCTTHNINQ